MHKHLKKLIAIALVLTMLPFGSIVAVSESADATGTEVVTDAETVMAEEGDSEEEDDDGLVPAITDEEAAALCEVAAENDRFILYFDEETERVGFYDKKNDCYWWSTGINALADASTTEKLRRNQMSNMYIRYGKLEDKTNSSNYYSFKDSTDKGKTKFKTIKDGLEITFKFGTTFTVPLVYKISDDCFTVSVDTANIKESDTSEATGKIITEMQIAPMMGAAEPGAEGYIIVPDGSGAVINFNNGKSSYPIYSQDFYGRDLTIVPLTAPAVKQTAALPTMSLVNGENGLVSIVTEGEGVASANASVSFQNGSMYNKAYYSFDLRGTDNYYLSGDANAIRVFEKGAIKIPKIEITYYPVKAESGDMVTYPECAQVVRDYLISQGMEKLSQANEYDLYVDMFGGVMKEQSILGLPIDLKTEMTSFDEAQKIVEKLKALGVLDMVVAYNDWTNPEIKGKISTTAKASGTLGGNGDFKDMLKAFNADGIELYPSYNNLTFTKSSFAFMSLTDTAIRVSNSYSRQQSYSRAYGIPSNKVAPALLSPHAYTEVFDKIVNKFSKKDYTNVAFGDYANTLVSDYAKSSYTNRQDAINVLVEGYKLANEKVGSVLGDAPNSYLIPYVDHITNAPLASSGFNVTDFDIPFYQMVLHGYVPYSTKAINGSADGRELFLLAIASGSAVHYDFIYEESSEVADTDYDTLFYANFAGWVDSASAEYRLGADVLAKVSDQIITGYEIDGDEITTTYANGYKTVVNLETGDIKADGKTYNLNDYLTGGAAQ